MFITRHMAGDNLKNVLVYYLPNHVIFYVAWRIREACQFIT